MAAPFELRQSRILHKGYVFEVVRDRIYHFKSRKLISRDVVLHRGAVAIIPFVSKRRILLLRQFRYAAKGDLWEIPAGTLERGELPLTCAKRELEEETGYRALRFKRLTSFYSAPGISNEVMTLYKAEALVKGVGCLDPDELISVREVSLKRAIEMIRRGLIRDAKSIIAILWVCGF